MLWATLLSGWISLESDSSFFLLASPKVQLSLTNKALPPTLICNIAGYYPLDVTVTWIREEPGGAPVPISGASFSSLRQSTAGTYSVSSFLKAEPGPEGTTYTCQVSHISLEEPLRSTAWVAPPGTRSALFSPPPYLGSWLAGPKLIFGLVLLPSALCSALAPFPRWQPP